MSFSSQESQSFWTKGLKFLSALTFNKDILTSQLCAFENAFQPFFFSENFAFVFIFHYIKRWLKWIGGWQNSLGKTKRSPMSVMCKGILPTKRASLWFYGWSFYRHIAFRLWCLGFFLCCFIYLLQTRGLRQPLWRKTIVNCEILSSFLRRFHWQSNSDKVSSTQLQSFCHDEDEHLPVGSS